jgi:hypothetical protein
MKHSLVLPLRRMPQKKAPLHALHIFQPVHQLSRKKQVKYDSAIGFSFFNIHQKYKKKKKCTYKSHLLTQLPVIL